MQLDLIESLKISALVGAVACAGVGVGAAEMSAGGLEGLGDIGQLVEKHCVRCHGGEKVKGKVDYTLLKNATDVDAAFEVWETAADLVAHQEMPPEDEPGMSAAEREQFAVWYQSRFVDSVEARPGDFVPRRLCVTEYRNTLRSLFGFDLESAVVEAEQTVSEKSLVVKLLPTDPPGGSGFTNDTHRYPLTTLIWDQYSFLVDAALERFFAKSHRQYLEAYTGEIGKAGLTTEQAEKLLRGFVPRAYRRDVLDSQIQPLINAIAGLKERKLVNAVKVELKTVLMSPGFIYRGVLMPAGDGKAGVVERVDDFELAERLSYFLWADMPDAELMGLARAGRLSDEVVYKGQIDRMLDSPKARNLADDFGVQWLTLNEIEDPRKNPPVTVALRSQPLDFLDYLFRQDRPVIELVDSDVTFISPFLGKYYAGDMKQLVKHKKQRGIEVEIIPNQQIKLEKTEGRGGILTMPGVLTMNKRAVLRGVWMLQRIMGIDLGEPPADVPPIEKTAPDDSLSFRERFEQHRSNAACALCHNKIDPMGFALDGYDESGGFIFASDYPKQKDRKMKVLPDMATIDTSAKLPSGEAFEGAAGLKHVLTHSQRGLVIRNVVERFMSYGLARKLELYDQPTVDRIAKELDSQQGTYRDLIYQIATSVSFRETLVKGDAS